MRLHLLWLGRTGRARDILSAILYGLRTSLIVGVGERVHRAWPSGTVVGLVAAYRGGWVDTVIMRIVDLQLSLPTILLALILLVLAGRGRRQDHPRARGRAVGLLRARPCAGVALVENTREYVDAARGLRLAPLRILFGHLLPNCLPTLIVIATVQIASAISLEATLSFLGLGLPPTQPSLGLLIANGFRYMMSGQYWISVFPGRRPSRHDHQHQRPRDRLRDVLNPRLEGLRHGRPSLDIVAASATAFHIGGRRRPRARRRST